MDRSLVSAGVKCYINGKDLGWVTGVTFNQSTPRKAITGIDTLVPFELIPLSTEVSGTIQLVKPKGDDSLEYRGVLSGPRNIIREKYFTLALIQRTDSGDSYLLFRADQCSVESQSWEIRPKSMVVGQFTFKGIEGKNAITETESLPK